MKERENSMPDSQKHWVRLPLENAHNVRELGGYPVKGGGQTAYHRFLRADDLSALTDNDMAFLMAYGVSMVIDLRSDDEAQKAPDRFDGAAGIQYRRIPFLGRDLADIMQASQADAALGLGALYASMLENKAVVKKLFEAIEQAPEGCIMFHCTAGKDRTGVLAMLLMSLAGADRQDCITNYEQSYINLTRKAEFTQMSEAALLAKYQILMYSLPETIANCYDYMTQTYGSAEAYLKECGLSEHQLEHIKRRLLEA